MREEVDRSEVWFGHDATGCAICLVWSYITGNMDWQGNGK